jgi:uncharacterized protein
MATTTTLLFEEPGLGNTAATLQAALARAQELGITQFVVASSTGRTALQAAEVLGGQGRVIGIHLARSFWDVYVGPDPELVAQAEARGVTFFTGPHGLMGAIDAALEDKGAFPAAHVIAYTLYTFSQGTKVAVEDVLMAADAGLLAMDEEVISLAGSSEGCDTALVVSPAYSNKFFDLRVREIIAKPR